ncbi:deoxyguanosinetriphosphate triphosphohydrolase family protein [Thalassotalea euphylliae]|uniref:Deoxyguanosinetriphosphate triphosphohydrolase-like protein n=1 Tax=Thalassotalea euphylliae TaxID=1655234 RepID=A0A3E0TRY9_9GAMM|nr:anti-phage deoxyguanosine triphosphatase [Thalassotalea euphylliae]REL27288.1 deoxyguanosinetriphosphate triphosphohydrolase family protein [Thalassotalea euphylliae]
MNQDWLARRLPSAQKRQQDHRSPFQRDRARILHSAAFRRLQSKTQVISSGQSDFYRTRLTHSLEAAQIGSGITAQLRSKYPELAAALFPDDDTLIEALCLAHDIGHPPFGHGGEVALHYMMRKHGGFEGNGQTLRIVARLEPFSEQHGMNLTRRSLLGLIKYPQLLDNLVHKIPNLAPVHYRQLQARHWHPPKGLYQDDSDIIDWVLAPLSPADRDLFQTIVPRDNQHSKTCFKSLDCSIMELADDIAYGIHDLEDAIVTGVVNRNDFDDHVIMPLRSIGDNWLSDYSEQLTNKLFSEHHYLQKDAIGGLVNYLITAIELLPVETQTGEFSEPLLKFNAKLPDEQAHVLQIFKDFVLQFVVKLPAIQRIEYRGQQVVMELFEALSSDPERLLPTSTAKRWRLAQEKGENAYRVIADYVAGMTDGYATRLYQTLFLPISAGDNYDAHS